jgi:hypothetical protein
MKMESQRVARAGPSPGRIREMSVDREVANDQ